ncbi:Tubulin epsilon chain [Homalodisca vitripennis]|nr:Tubulin epsilon chain [Homalodisca vitripennis]
MIDIFNFSHISLKTPLEKRRMSLKYALGDICERHQLNKGTKPFQDVNNVIVSMLLNLTSGSRFSGSLNCDLSDLSSLVPRPSLHYLSASLSPLDLNLSRDVSFVNK